MWQTSRDVNRLPRAYREVCELVEVTVQSYQMLIDGAWVPAITKETSQVINPATSEVIAGVPKGGREDANSAVDAARDAFDKGRWPRMSPGETRIHNSEVCGPRRAMH